ncbi:ATP-binding protein [Jeotgalibacillus proteolyticus]|uniref:histidine kinase n=1 Tax=Jeotgalibacillus proteolyticus TaxID=2082395 RepID=A0A2S5G7I2_9BACL|nr:sensor histidine kinase [Jeotgalibacillus proteolyticus]PPA68903.1 sensor histidine kinase [Jeotgalibacillus proteolyticus]
MPSFSLQSKIILLNVFIIFIITIAISSALGFKEMQDTKEDIGTRALDVATTVAISPTVIHAMNEENPSIVLQPFTKHLATVVGAEFVVIGNAEGIRYAHPEEEKLGLKMVGGDNDAALIDGNYYISEADGSLGRSLRGKAPIYSDEGEIIGIVSVGYMIDDIQQTVYQNILEVIGFSLIVLVLGIIGSIILAENIRKDTMGLEPREIAALYRDREAILSSIAEGVISIDSKGVITTMNQSAQKILNLDSKGINKHIRDVIPESGMYELLQKGEKPTKDLEVLIGDKVIVTNRTLIMEDDKVVGMVSSFRDKTEIEEMINTLSEVQQYSEGLRAQTHEYTNKLYAISGLLQLEHYDDAIELIQEEASYHENQMKSMLGQIQDKKVQAILLGKLGKASEQKVKLMIDENSSLHELPGHVDITKIIHILGNLLDNAIEEVRTLPVREVNFFITDVGNDIVIEVSDSGRGIQAVQLEKIFEQGFSTKEKADRGYGLAIVKNAVESLKGSIEINHEKEGGAIFTVYLPKAV